MEVKKVNNLSKRQQITASNKTVFMWVAGASIIAAFSLVAIIFLAREMVFREKVLTAKATTESNVKANVQTADTLRSNINVLLSNSALSKVKTAADTSNLQVVFDALPTSYDSANFGASLQGVLLAGTVTSIESLSVVSQGDDGGDGTDVASSDESTGTAAKTMQFNVTIKGTADQIRNALTNMEQSIRPIKVTGITIDGGSPLTARISGETYYESPVELKLSEKTIKP